MTNEPRLSTFQLACSLPADPQFREWAALQSSSEPLTVKEAGDFVKAVCGIVSRNALKTDAAAEQRFHQFLRRPFLAWKQQAPFEGESGPAERPRRTPTEARM
ncbi:hypothetical protein [Burkholderia gladioli]|uniref:hypothetical protein n=1 Tax=Burkholderia gladioli TaxID=28095 RepID=UPI00163E9933|nr:hypothetical protein [Burkholderia gladioli]